ncbi:Uncharacterised protein [Candidatus Bartonella washoeensis]|uniref:Uncharacterized protein n=1 Tax=Candidatus Bartonella washoeensis Sb944nv TaxID=1094563 RepID=J0Q590_9HYPH|nr:hypothetical protein [Bartonella washoeensis]EJF77794.1 hypothetical protein MCQ_01484 [Bartonella washoeensis Sb944nv]SPU26922.1 Uncharacterised protein [Bartonella washoeensis]
MANELPQPLQGRNLHTQQVSFLRLDFTHEEQVMKIGTLPCAALITSIKVYVKTAFTGAKLKFGSTTEVKDFSEADIGTQGIKALTISNQKEFVPYDEELTLYAKLDKQVASGQATVIVEFVTNH